MMQKQAAPQDLGRELTDEEVFGPPAAKSAPRFVEDFYTVLANMQREWTEPRGLDDAPPVVLLVDKAAPSGVMVFAWPSPWLH
ncbi:hypothetical protein [Limnohabitans sp. Hippo3]|uniref:hypothetical protein n=1 Tax=Limnohabitans sp. Hippo3 TaxID=1597956 RepID=UPI000D359544|nr:hypothetical protein [Limnohabitans sp. Hippo3]PUE39197.1 hypothetical protein B9Z34_09535 [Limnohabitans sp. Hippo3]